METVSRERAGCAHVDEHTSTRTLSLSPTSSRIGHQTHSARDHSKQNSSGLVYARVPECFCGGSRARARCLQQGQITTTMQLTRASSHEEDLSHVLPPAANCAPLKITRRETKTRSEPRFRPERICHASGAQLQTCVHVY